MSSRLRNLANTLNPPPRWRQCVCVECNWVVAAKSLEQVHEIGWRITNDREGSLCATCAVAMPEIVLPPGAWEAQETLFGRQKRAPRDAFPRVGGVGPEHAETSRPE